MVSTTTFEALVSAHAQFLIDHGRQGDPQQEILRFLDWEEPEYESFAREVRIVPPLASSEDGLNALTTNHVQQNERGTRRPLRSTFQLRDIADCQVEITRKDSLT